MTVSELKLKLKQAELIEQQQRDMPNDQYVAKLHYHAIDAVSRIRFELMNHPELSFDDYYKIFAGSYDKATTDPRDI